MPFADQPVVRCDALSISLGGAEVLHSVDLAVRAGEVVGIRGSSGSGKSTLLHALAGLLLPDEGEVHFNGERVDTWSDRRRSELRLRHFGVVFQAGDLIPELTIGENVELPLRLLGHRKQEARNLARTQLDELGIGELCDRPLSAASGGQVQRAALARALVHRPSVLLADEPTGALDDENASAAMTRVVALARDHGIATIVVTHAAGVADVCDRVVMLDGGKIEPAQVHA